MNTVLNIRYMLIGEAENNKIITELSNASCSEKSKNTAPQIYQKLVKSPLKQYEQRNKIDDKEQQQIFYFLITQPNLLFIVLVDEKYPERLVFQMIDKIKEEKVLEMINEETKELNAQGIEAIKFIVDSYQEPANINKIADIQKDIDEIKVQMNDNIKKQVSGMDDVQNLEEKSNQLKSDTAEYANNANDLKKETCIQSWKLTIIIVALIVLVALAITLPLILL